MHKIMPQDVIYLATPFTSKALIKPAGRRQSDGKLPPRYAGDTFSRETLCIPR